MSGIFTVTANRDAEAGVFTSQSDIPGLVVDAETFEELILLVQALAPEVIVANLPDEPQPYDIKVKTFWARIDATDDTTFIPEAHEQPRPLEHRVIFKQER